MRAYLTVHSLLALALFGFAARSAHAQSTCRADSDCVRGWACEVTGGGTCGAKACAPGETCDPQPSDCVNVEYRSCVPGPCRADRDCADGMVCYTHTESDCVPVACAPGQECPVPECAPRTESACVPRYVLPCTTANDCGAGFTCESAGEECECSGSAGGSDPGLDGGTPTPPSPPEESCTCTASDEQRCRVVPVTCTADDDCVGGWTCVVVAATSDCSSPALPPPTPGSEGAGSGAADAGAPAPDCSPSTKVKQCMPPYYLLVSGGRGFDSKGGSDEGGTPATDDNGAAPGNGEVASPVTPSAGSDKDDTTSSAGCSVSRGSSGGFALALLGVLGLFGGLRRRRAR